MVAQDVAALLAGSATLVQLAAGVPALLLLKRRPLPLLSPVIIAALMLMVFRRALAAAVWPALRASAGIAVTHEAAGLAVSVAIVFGIVLLWRAGNTPATSDSPKASNLEVALTEVASARTEERELLCYDLHDGLAQLVMGSRMHLDAYNAARDKDAERAEREFGLMSHCLEQAVDEVTRIISDLSLTLSTDVSVDQAVKCYLDKLTQAHGWACEFDNHIEQRRFAKPVESMVYRLVQEALNNVAKHARARRVRVSLSVEDDALLVVVQDWGCGFEPEEAEWNTRHLGLRSMCSRADLVGGSCTIESQPGRGTTITSRVPCCGAQGGSR